MVGNAIYQQLQSLGHDVIVKSRSDLDLIDQNAVKVFFEEYRPDVVVMAAAKVGGIHANNTYPADFIYQNLMVQSNIIHQAYVQGVSRLLFLGSSCIYPRDVAQPMAEGSLLTGGLEPTNEPYAIAKIAGIKLCESYHRQYGVDFRSVMPTNLYGPGDNFHPDNSHVVPALIRKFHQAKLSGSAEVAVWGTGSPLREFMHVNDLAAGALFVLGIDQKTFRTNLDPMCSHINIGTGFEISILELATMVAEVVEFEGAIVFDKSKPDGAPRKLMDCSRLQKLGWQASIDLKSGLKETYKWYSSKILANSRA